jgi:membrane-associated phospholipid phosphatase
MTTGSSGSSPSACRMLFIQNDITTIVLIGIALLLVAGALVGDRKRAAALVAAGLLMAFTALAIGVHAHGWVTAFDALTASWIGKAIHRSHGLDEASLMAARLGSPAVIAAAGLIGGALMSWRARSVRPGVIVIATVGAATLAATAIKAVVDRPLTQAEVLAPTLLSTDHHPFPSGHVAGTGALLGIIAVCIGVGRSRIMRALLTALVVTGVLIVAFSRLYLGLHWLTDVVGGALLAALFVILGDVALRMRRRPVWPRRRPGRDQPRAQGVDQPDIRGSRWTSMWRHSFPVCEVIALSDCPGSW